MTHRTELARSLALNPRSSAVPAPQRGDGFAALLDAQTSRPAADAARPRHPEASRPADGRERDDLHAPGRGDDPRAAVRGDATDERAAAGPGAHGPGNEA
jgi:hypothetical protein